MNEREQQALERLLQGKYAAVAPETTRRVFEENLLKYKKLKDADKAARAQLHQMSEAYASEQDYKRARECLRAYGAGEAGALDEALRLHASTRERIESAEEIFSRVYGICGEGMTLDLACGFNPLFLGSRGHAVRGVEVSRHTAELVNDWAHQAGWDVCVFVGDLTRPEALPQAHLALLMKLLPLLEQQKAGAGAALLARVQSEWVLVSFPTRTLGGRNVGMERQYAAWMEGNCPKQLRCAERFAVNNEMFYLLHRE